MKHIKLTHNATPKTRIENLTVWMNNQSTFRQVVNLVVLLCWQESFRKNYSDLSARIVKLWIHGKKPFLVKYLKVCYLMVVAWISDKTYIRAPGDPLVTSDKYGLPSIIPLDIRRAMSEGPRRDRDWHMVQAVLTIFSTYRVLRIPGKLKLSTIVDPFSGIHQTVEKRHITRALRSLLGTNNLPKFYPKWRFQHLTTAGPNGSPATLGILIDAFVLLREKNVRRNFLKITYYLENGFVLKGVFYFSMVVSLLTYWAWSPLSTKRSWTSGRLAEKEEAAGKVRVFAITDWFTQNALHPLHNCLYKILKGIPTDGTMNQDAAFERLNKAAGLDVPIWSFDLSAATDRLPVALQRDVLSHFIGEDLSQTWIDLLTDRFWDHKGNLLRYAVGQPIGAYSSWAILALTHHVIVQMAYQISHQTSDLFDRYAVLGDDVVIYEERTANAYLSLIRGFGVEINMSKSVISSNGTFEFAKRIGHAGLNLSPLGSKAMLIGINNPDLFSVTLIDSMTKIGYDIDEARDRLAVLKDNGYYPASTMRAYEVGLYGPGGVHEKKVDLITYVNRSRTLSSMQTQVLAKRMTEGLLWYYEAELKKIFEAAWDLTYKPVISHLWPGLLDRTLLGFVLLDIFHPASIYWRIRVSRIRKEVRHPLWIVRNLHSYYDALDDHLSLVSAYTALIDCGVPILPLEFAPEKNAESRKAAVTLGTVQQRVNYISFAKTSGGSYKHAISPRIWYPRPTLYLKKSK